MAFDQSALNFSSLKEINNYVDKVKINLNTQLQIKQWVTISFFWLSYVKPWNWFFFKKIFCSDQNGVRSLTSNWHYHFQSTHPLGAKNPLHENILPYTSSCLSCFCLLQVLQVSMWSLSKGWRALESQRWWKCIHFIHEMLQHLPSNKQIIWIF